MSSRPFSFEPKASTCTCNPMSPLSSPNHAAVSNVPRTPPCSQATSCTAPPVHPYLGFTSPRPLPLPPPPVTSSLLDMICDPSYHTKSNSENGRSRPDPHDPSASYPTPFSCAHHPTPCASSLTLPTLVYVILSLPKSVPSIPSLPASASIFPRTASVPNAHHPPNLP